MDTLIHILHLEDDPADADLVQAMLAEAGLACRITRAQTRNEYETALRDAGTQIILADYRLPTYDGMSALRLSRELRADIPFIFVSGAMGEEAAIEALTQGATDYVLKHNLSRLAPAVRRALQEARNRRERRQAQEALQRSNEMLRAIIEAAPVAIIGLDLDGHVHSLWNPTAEKMLGWRAQEVMGRPLPTVPADRQEEFRCFREQIRKGITLDGMEVHRQRRDGTPIDYSIYASPLHDAQGRVNGNMAVLVDITERKRAEAALRASEARYIDLYDNAPDMYVSVDAQTACIDKCNQTLADTLGFPKAKIIGRSVFDIYHPDCLEQAESAFRQFLENGAIQDKELQLRKKDGSKLDVSLNVSAVRAKDGTIVASRSTLRDITERRHNRMINSARIHLMQFAGTHSLDELLEETINEAEKVTESLIGFYVFVDDDQQALTLQNWSTRTKAQFCKARGKGLHYHIADAGVWVDCVRERKPVMHNDYISLPHRRGLPEGHAEVVRELVVPVMRGGKIKAVLGVGNKPADYSQKDVEAMSLLADLAWEAVISKRAEEKLRRSEEKYRRLNKNLEKRVAERTVELENRAQKLQQLALELSGAEDRERRHIASILHDDFQQQLAYIKMELDLLRKDSDKKVEQKLGRLARLTAECIEKSRNLSYEINPPVLHRSGLLAAIDALAKDMERNQGLAVTVRTHPNAEPASFSLASILYRSVRELLFNVVKHAGVNSAVIDVQSNNRFICIRVEDDGNGFDFDAVRSGQGSGVGFGLYNIEDRMVSLGGSMEVNAKPGKGCCVLLTVPRNVSRKTTGSKAPLEKRVQKGFVGEMSGDHIQSFKNREQIRILLADDHALMREALAKLLQECTDLTVVGQAVDGREAVQLAEKLKPHVILMDVTMPKLSGFEATAQIIRAQPAIRIIGLSMHNDGDTRQKMLNAGASAYLTKTGSPDALIGTIRRLHRG